MFSKMMNERYFCGLDIGSQSIKAGILRIKDRTDINLMGVYEQKTYGFRNNAVSDLNEFSECIHRTIEELAEETGVKIKDVFLGIGGALVDARQTHTAIPLIDRGNKIITYRDVKKVNDHARLLGIQMDEEALHVLPQNYKIDDRNSALNPLGLYGRKLGVRSLMIIVNSNNIRNISKAVHQAGYDVTDVFFNSFCASEVILTEPEKKEGCVLLDIGAQYSTGLVFSDGVMQYLEGVPIGGDHFTHHIAQQMGLPFEMAEEIKKSYAVACGFDQYEHEEILVKKEDAYVPVKRGLISQAIKSEVEGFVRWLGNMIAHAGINSRLKGGIVVIGGGGLLSGLIERIEQDLQQSVKFGQLNLPLRRNLNYTALFSSVVGLARGGYKKTLRHSLSAGSRHHWAKQFSNRIKELYHEYF